MKIHVLSGKQLNSEDRLLWSQFQQADPALASPYFRPEFVEAVAEVRRDVEVAVLEQEGRKVGFFPFQRGAWKTARPVAAGLSDFQGLVGNPRGEWLAEELLRGCGLAAWNFDHLIASQQSFGSGVRVESASPFIDLACGFDAYDAARARAGCRVLPKIRQSVRQAEKRLGPMRFEMHTTARSAVDALWRWKTAKFLGTGYTNVLGFRWVSELLERIRSTDTPEFAGVLSCVSFGDRLAAVHLGMRSSSVLHYWFPAYDPELRQFSPGMILLMAIAQAAPTMGVRRIDLGKGDEDYKLRLMSGATMVAEGSIECRPLSRAWGQVRRSVSRWTRDPWLGAPARLAAQFSRPVRRWLMFR